MGRKLPDEVVNHVLAHFQAGRTVPQVHEATKIAKSCLYKLRLNMDLWGTPYAPPTVKTGHPKALLLS